jgi:hypothetical protein
VGFGFRGCRNLLPWRDGPGNRISPAEGHDPKRDAGDNVATQGDRKYLIRIRARRRDQQSKHENRAAWDQGQRLLTFAPGRDRQPNLKNQ